MKRYADEKKIYINVIFLSLIQSIDAQLLRNKKKYHRKGMWGAEYSGTNFTFIYQSISNSLHFFRNPCSKFISY